MDGEGTSLVEMLDEHTPLEEIAALMESRFGRPFDVGDIEGFLDDLTDTMKSDRTHTYRPTEELFATGGVSLRAPESVHISLTDRCNLRCSACYKKGYEGELSTMSILSLIDTLSGMNVFQVAFGGGEPFLREDISEILEYVRDRGMVPNITTNGTLLDETMVNRIRSSVGAVAVSVNGHSPETNIGRDADSFTSAIRGMKLLLEGGVRTGVNVLVCRSNLQYLDTTLSYLFDEGAHWATCLRMKPGEDNELLTREDMGTLRRILDVWSFSKDVRVDTALSCLMSDLPGGTLQMHGVHGCTAGLRFCTVESDGTVYPCSFLQGPEFAAGNILEGDFENIWSDSFVFHTMRSSRGLVEGRCSSCDALPHCGGCRAIALYESGSLFGDDLSCMKEDDP